MGRLHSRHPRILPVSAQGNRARLARGGIGKETPKAREGPMGHPPEVARPNAEEVPRRNVPDRYSGARSLFNKVTVDIIELPVALEREVFDRR